MGTYRNREFICTSEITIGLISGKWKPLILGFLSGRTYRFNELQKLMPEATQKMLTLQLRDMEKDGLVHRRVYAVVPPKVEYSLTELGEKLVPMLTYLCHFGSDYMRLFPDNKQTVEAADASRNGKR